MEKVTRKATTRFIISRLLTGLLSRVCVCGLKNCFVQVDEDKKLLLNYRYNNLEPQCTLISAHIQAGMMLKDNYASVFSLLYG